MEKKTLYRDRLCQISFSLILVSLIYAFVSHTLVSQLANPVLRFSGDDLSYWIFNLLSVPKWIAANYMAAILFDIILFVTSILTIVYPAKRIWPRIFFIFYFIYFVIYNTYGTHHEHARAGVLLLSLPFLISGETGFSFLWEGLRYYTCFIYVSAFGWKLVRGSWLSGQQGILLIKKNLTPYLYYNPQSTLAKIYFFVFQYPGIADVFVKAGFILEGCFIVGFFTRRYDKYLFLLAILLPIGFWFMADALFFEVAFLAVAFYVRRGKTTLD